MAIGESKLHRVIKRRRLLSDAVAWYDTFDTQLKVQVLDWIRKDQLLAKGIDATGEVIGYYSLATSLINPKKRFNTHFTLYDEGDFFRSMFVQVLATELRISANSPSFTEMKLQDWYNENILNLTEENLAKLKAKVRQSYIEQVRAVLQVD